MKSSPVFHLQVTVTKTKVLPVSLKLQAHLKDWIDFNSSLADPEAWSETLNGSEFYMYSAFLQTFDLVSDVLFLQGII